jgi:hypothetical protein
MGVYGNPPQTCSNKRRRRVFRTASSFNASPISCPNCLSPLLRLRLRPLANQFWVPLWAAEAVLLKGAEVIATSKPWWPANVRSQTRLRKRNIDFLVATPLPTQNIRFSLISSAFHSKNSGSHELWLSPFPDKIPLKNETY